MKIIRNYFLTGLFTLLPVFATIYILYYLFAFLDNLLGRYIKTLTGSENTGIGIFSHPSAYFWGRLYLYKYCRGKTAGDVGEAPAENPSGAENLLCC